MLSIFSPISSSAYLLVSVYGDLASHIFKPSLDLHFGLHLAFHLSSSIYHFISLVISLFIDLSFLLSSIQIWIDIFFDRQHLFISLFICSSHYLSLLSYLTFHQPLYLSFHLFIYPPFHLGCANLAWYIFRPPSSCSTSTFGVIFFSLFYLFINLSHLPN